MKTLVSSILIVSSLSATASEFTVNIRDAKKKLVAQTRSIPVLSPELAETEHFRVHKAENDTPVELGNDKKAATVLYHLGIARDYFKNVLGSGFVAAHPQVTVRIEMAKPFNENLHYIEESAHEEFNNALTIPASGPKALGTVDKWNTEIWFRPMKAIKIDNPVYQMMNQLDQVDASTTVGPVVEGVVTDLAAQAAISGTFNSLDYMGALSQVLFVAGALEVLPKVVKFATKSIKSEAYLDTALIPEVIYHEFAHVALSDYISVRKSTPLNEGMANYFAAVINQSAKIAAKNGSASKNTSAYNGASKELYHSIYETKASGQTNFVLSYLWRIRARFAREFTDGGEIADRLVFQSRKYITHTGKPIRDDLTGSLRAAIPEVFSKSQERQARMILADETRKAGL